VLTWYAPFYLYPALAWAAAAAVWLLIPAPAKPAGHPLPPRAYLDDLRQTWRRKGVSLLGTFLAGFTALFVFFGFLSHYSDLLEDPYGVTGLRKGLVMAVPAACMALASYFNSTLVLQPAPSLAKPILLAGLGTVAAGAACTYILPGFYTLGAAAAGLGAGTGVALSALNNLVTSSVGKDQRGVVTSLYGTVRFFGAALGPPAFAQLAGVGPAVVTLGAGALAAAVAAATAVLVHQRALIGEALSHHLVGVRDHHEGRRVHGPDDLPQPRQLVAAHDGVHEGPRHTRIRAATLQDGRPPLQIAEDGQADGVRLRGDHQHDPRRSDAFHQQVDQTSRHE
ncbi:MAG: MFS transporter, partial [Clostridia bacterium]|nr:MFS transporter [Clostridia bacterium]